MSFLPGYELGDWVDPFPPPVIEEHDGFFVVRDDLLSVGSKVRFLDYLIGHDPATQDVREWVYGSSPACGYAQISLAYVCSRYGKKAVVFSAKRSLENLHPYQRRAIEEGVEFRWVNMGMLNVTQARAREYAKGSTLRRLLPMGLEQPSVLACVKQVARSLSFVPDVVWSAGSSGTLTRGLQEAWPETEFHVVSVGHRMSERERGRAILHESPLKFNQEVPQQERPPFSSVPNYDAKAWVMMKEYYQSHRRKGKVLFWNVGG